MWLLLIFFAPSVGYGGREKGRRKKLLVLWEEIGICAGALIIEKVRKS